MDSESLIVIVVIIIFVFLLAESFYAKSQGNRSLFERLFDTLFFGGLPFSEKKDRPSANDDLGSLLFTMALAFMAFHALKKTYSFLKDVDWNLLTEQDREAISRFSRDLDRLKDNNARLDRAERLASLGDRISIEESALLTSATLEAGLKHLQEYNRVALTEDQSEGIVGLAIALRDRGLVSGQEYREIRRYVSNVRNKVMHGEFDSIDESEVQAQIRFARGFFAAHGFA